MEKEYFYSLEILLREKYHLEDGDVFSLYVVDTGEPVSGRFMLKDGKLKKRSTYCFFDIDLYTLQNIINLKYAVDLDRLLIDNKKDLDKRYTDLERSVELLQRRVLEHELDNDKHSTFRSFTELNIFVQFFIIFLIASAVVGVIMKCF